jgi:hypothetical protein
MTTRHAASGVDDSVLTGMTGTLPTGALNLFEGFARKHAGMVFVVGDVQGSNVRVRVGEEDLLIDKVVVRRLLDQQVDGASTPVHRGLGPAARRSTSPSRSVPTGLGLRRQRSVAEDARRGRETELERTTRRQAAEIISLEKDLQRQIDGLQAKIGRRASGATSPAPRGTAAARQTSMPEVAPEAEESVSFDKLLSDKGIGILTKPLVKARFDKDVLAVATIDEVIDAVGPISKPLRRLVMASGLINDSPGDAAPEVLLPTTERASATLGSAGKPVAAPRVGGADSDSLLEHLGDLV